MKLSLLAAVCSSLTLGIAQAKTPGGAVTIPRPSAEILHSAFSGFNTLTEAEGVVDGDLRSADPEVNDVAQSLEVCKIANQSNATGNTETINGVGCPINYKGTADYTVNSQASNSLQYTKSSNLFDSDLRTRLSILSAIISGTSINSRTMTTWHSEGPGHTVITTMQNHNIVADFYVTEDGTIMQAPNGAIEYNTNHMTTNGTVTLDNQKFTGSATYDAGVYGQQWTCTINQVVADCSQFFYVFGGSPQAPGNGFGGFARIRR